MSPTAADPAAVSAERLQLVRTASGRFLRAVNLYQLTPEPKLTEAMLAELRRLYDYMCHLFGEFSDDLEVKDLTEAVTATQKAEAGYELIFGTGEVDDSEDEDC